MPLDKKKLSIRIAIVMFIAYCIVFAIFFEREVSEDPSLAEAKKQKTIIGRDGVVMVLIPAGKFLMGSRKGYSNEKPIHTVYLDAFYIDKYEITNAQYKRFMDAAGKNKPSYWNNPNFNKPNQPVVGVTWYDAVAYAEWVGKRLPTEAEWEKAARGGLKGEEFPWGSTEPNIQLHNYANYFGIYGKDKWNFTAPVDSFEPNGYELYNMAGNVWEWCSDWSDLKYYNDSPKNNPKGPNSGKTKIIRGGAWTYKRNDPISQGTMDIWSIASLRNSNREGEFPETSDNSIGFRCAMDTVK